MSPRFNQSLTGKSINKHIECILDFQVLSSAGCFRCTIYTAYKTDNQASYWHHSDSNDPKIGHDFMKSFLVDLLLQFIFLPGKEQL